MLVSTKNEKDKKMKSVIMFLVCMSLSVSAMAGWKDSLVTVTIVNKQQVGATTKVDHLTGNGFYVRENLIMTAIHHHTIKANALARTVTVYQNGAMFTGAIVFKSAVNDIVLVKVYRKGSPLNICTDTRISDKIDVWFTGVNSIYKRSGWVDSNFGYQMTANIIAIKGDSGAPALLERNQCVIGMLIKYDDKYRKSIFVNTLGMQSALRYYNKPELLLSDWGKK